MLLIRFLGPAVLVSSHPCFDSLASRSSERITKQQRGTGSIGSTIWYQSQGGRDLAKSTISACVAHCNRLGLQAQANFDTGITRTVQHIGFECYQGLQSLYAVGYSCSPHVVSPRPIKSSPLKWNVRCFFAVAALGNNGIFALTQALVDELFLNGLKNRNIQFAFRRKQNYYTLKTKLYSI